MSEITSGDRLAGKVALVTGAGSAGPLLGIGETIAMLFAKHGARVAVADISPERAENTLSVISKARGEAMATVGDVTSEDDCQRMVEETVDRFGSVGVLVNNAAIVVAGSVVEVERSEWDRCLAVNLTSVMLMSKYALPHMARVRQGSVINISSIAALRAMGTGAYAAAKGGMIALTKDMAFLHGRDGIRVNCVAPGYVYTPMGSFGGPDVRELHRRAGLLGVEGTPWDVAYAAMFFASDESRWVTATTLPVDAGATAATVQENWPWAAELAGALARIRGSYL